ncbi:MAG UNVERIFIED_CONTAM: hypothetical protein LVT10_23190 [Anaerolineae bacterium]
MPRLPKRHPPLHRAHHRDLTGMCQARSACTTNAPSPPNVMTAVTP